MPPRVAYWTSAFEARMEAIAGEVALLRRHFPSSVSWGLSRHHWVMLSRRRGYCLHPRLHLVFRAASRLFEPLFQINHVFGSLGDWFYLQGARKRPTILTAAATATPVEKPLLDRIDRFVAEHPAGREELQALGIDADRIRLIFPPVDLKRFTPAENRSDRLTVLFASSPDDAGWLPARGIPQLLDAAALKPNCRFRLLWRPWGDSLPVVRSLIKERSLNNVDLIVGRIEDMADEYRNAHLTLVPFTDPVRCKPAPNSLIESLACGRPVICSPQVGLAQLVEENRAGIVCPAAGDRIAEAIDRIKKDWTAYSQHARQTAEKHFAETAFVDSYRRLYAELTA